MAWLKRLRYLLAGAMALLGVAHCAFTTQLFDMLSLDALWFISGGIAMICVALSNLHKAHAGRRQLGLLLAQNTMLLGFFIALWSVFPAIQVVIGIALLAGLLALNLTGLHRAQPVRA